MLQSAPSLDADELVALAVRATRSGNSKQAVAYLTRALESNPDHGPAHHLLAGLYASMKRFDRAVAEMQRAVELEADPSCARFELGMMYFTIARIADARAAWEPLEALGEDHALCWFARGMQRLIRDEFEDCVADLQRGLSCNVVSPALNQQIEKVIAMARRKL